MTIDIMSLCVFYVPKEVWSPGCDHGHDEESRNGQDIKIDILEGYIWTSEWFRTSSGIFRSIGRLPEPPGKYWAYMGLSGEGGGPQGVAACPPWQSDLDLGRGRRPPFPLPLPLLRFPSGGRKKGGNPTRSGVL